MPLLNLGPCHTVPARDSFSPGGPLYQRGRKFAALFSFLPWRAARSDFRVRIFTQALGAQGGIRNARAASPIRSGIFVLCSSLAIRRRFFSS